jgi:hypothetical protein
VRPPYVNERLLHVDLGCYSQYLFDYYKTDKDVFKKGFINISNILEDCDSIVEEVIAVGFFESFQNRVLDSEISLDAFNQYLSPKSKMVWDGIIKFWNLQK